MSDQDLTITNHPYFEDEGHHGMGDREITLSDHTDNAAHLRRKFFW